MSLLFLLYTAWQVKDLWSTFQRELSHGLPPVVSYPTSAVADSLVAGKRTLPPLPPHRVFQPPLAIVPGHFELPDEACIPPTSSGGGSTFCVEVGNTACVAEKPDETSAPLRPDEDERPQEKTATSLATSPTPAPLTSAVAAVAPVAGFGCFSYPDVDIELKAKPAFVEEIELKAKADLVGIETKTQSDIPLGTLQRGA